VEDDSQSRFLIALALSMAVILLWMRYFAPKPGTVPPAEQPAQTVEAPAETVAPPQQQVSTAAAPQPTGQEIHTMARPEDVAGARDVTIETSLLRATFTTLGGRLRSVQLKRYTFNGGETVELIPQAELAADTRLPLGITIPGPNVRDNPDTYLFDATVIDSTVVMECLLDCGLRLRKEFRFKDDMYTVESLVTFINETSDVVYVGQDVQPSYQFAWEPAVEKFKESKGGMYGSTMGPAWMGANDKYREKRKPTEVDVLDAQWAGVKSRYFAAVIRPEHVPARVIGQPLGGGGQRVAIAAPSFPLDPGATRTDRYELFIGPLELGMLRSLGHRYNRLVSFGLFWPLSEGMLWILRASHSVVPNYGIAIIFLTVLSRVLLYPLTRKSLQSMKKMQELRPAMQEIEQKYKDKPQERAKKMMELQREHGISMFGGCLPMLAQFPIWIALFRTLLNAIELRGAGFMFWIDDLSAPDALFHLPFTLPFIGSDFNLLPLLMAGMMFAQQKMMPAAGTGAQADSQKMMMTMMPVMMGVLFYAMPSGLCLYILVSNLLQIGQQYLVHRGMKTETVPAKPAKRAK